MTASSSNLVEPLVALISSSDMLGVVFSLAGEIGMVSRGTGELGLTAVEAVSTVAIKRRKWRRRKKV